MIFFWQKDSRKGIWKEFWFKEAILFIEESIDYGKAQWIYQIYCWIDSLRNPINSFVSNLGGNQMKNNETMTDIWMILIVRKTFMIELFFFKKIEIQIHFTVFFIYFY